MPNPSVPDLRARLLQLAIDYHKAEEGEYGCNGATCPAVQRLLSFAERAAGAALLDAGSGEPETCPRCKKNPRGRNTNPLCAECWQKAVETIELLATAAAPAQEEG